MTEVRVHGSVVAGFEAVRDEFAALLDAEGSDLDAQVAAYRDGHKVVDLWAGDQMQPDSLLGIYSATKGVTHLVVALLVQEGVLDLDQRVSHYWPEFAAEGKGEVSLRQLLSHQAGLPGTDAGFSTDELADDRIVAERLGAQHPFWRPGSAAGYHALVMGALSSEVVRRATGRVVQDHVVDRFSDAYDLDLHLGLSPQDDRRFLPAQPMIVTPERLRALAATATAPGSLSGIAFNRQHPDHTEVWELPNQPAVRARGTASFGGVSTARDLARLYAAAISPVDGRPPLLRPDTFAAFGQIQTNGPDLVLREPKAWAVGFHPVSELYPSLGAGAFGHSGAGGQQAFADPRHGLSYAFLRRRPTLPAHAHHDHETLVRALVTAARTTTG